MRADLFSEPFEVRDYECDLQGIVNNAVYLHYLEHARHQYLKSKGLDFAALTAEGVHLVVVRAEVEYKAPLRSGDRFVVRMSARRVSRIQFAFDQEIYRVPDERLMLTSVFTCTSVNAKGRPYLPGAIEQLLSS